MHDHQQDATHTHIDSGTTGSTSRPKGSVDVVLMLSDANDLSSSTGLRQDHRERLSQEIMYRLQTSYCSGRHISLLSYNSPTKHLFCFHKGCAHVCAYPWA